MRINRLFVAIPTYASVSGHLVQASRIFTFVRSRSPRHKKARIAVVTGLPVPGFEGRWTGPTLVSDQVGCPAIGTRHPDKARVPTKKGVNKLLALRFLVYYILPAGSFRVVRYLGAAISENNHYRKWSWCTQCTMLLVHSFFLQQVINCRYFCI